MKLDEIEQAQADSITAAAFRALQITGRDPRDEIETLKTENARLRAALESIAIGNSGYAVFARKTLDLH